MSGGITVAAVVVGTYLLLLWRINAENRDEPTCAGHGVRVEGQTKLTLTRRNGSAVLLMDRVTDQLAAGSRRLCALSDVRHIQLVGWTERCEYESWTEYGITYALKSDPRQTVQPLLELGVQPEAEARELAGQLAGFAGVELRTSLPSS